MKKRSKYRPKGVRLDPVSWVISGLKTVADVPGAGLTVILKNHSALDSAVKGVANRDEIDVLVNAINAAEALCFMGIGEDWKDEILEASEALLNMAKRGVKNDHYIFTGPEMNAVKLAIEIHDLQLKNCTVQQLEKAIDIIGDIIKKGKAKRIEA